MSPAKRKPADRKPAEGNKNAAKVVTDKRAAPATWSDHGVEVARELAAIAESHAVAELIYETVDLTLTIRRGEGAMMPAQIHAPMQHVVASGAPLAPIAAAPTAANAVAAVPELVVEDHLHVVTSPFVGTFYRAPNPDTPPYAEIGQRVEVGQTLCIVEAMKLMNEIEADVAGTIVAILGKNAESVEYGQSLFKIDPT